MSPSENSPDHPREYREFFELFNKRRFYDAHEVLEDLWVMEVPPLRNYYKGLIMAAVALCHWQRGNCGPARNLFRDARNYLAAYPPVIEDFPLAAFLGEMDRLFEPIMDGAQSPYPVDDVPTLRLLN